MSKVQRSFTQHPGRDSLSWFRVMVALSLLLGLLGPQSLAAPETLPMNRSEGQAPAVSALADSSSPKTLVPIGRAVGIKLFSDGVMVVGFSQIPAGQGAVTPAKTCGLREGDVITHINAAEVDTIEEVQACLEEIGGEAMSIRAIRAGQPIQITARAVKCSTDGNWRLGAWLRDSMAGIGTITWYDPENGNFGALGHGINDADTAQLMPLEHGGLLTAHVSDVKKGQRGEPGELHGEFETDHDIGSLRANTPVGIFGSLNSAALSAYPPMEVAKPNQIHTGKATILSNVGGDSVEEYGVEILRLLESKDGRDMVVKVTDPRLLETTGGIVQGMSGSPILQDGRLIGAVTHVLISDPTQGYGVFLQRMLNHANDLT